jgi:hypothetical protein
MASGENIMKALALTIMMIASLQVLTYGESVVTLKSGKILQGQILSDTNGVLQIRAFSANRTYSALRNVSDSEIQSIHTETSAEIAERTDYEALSKFELNPNQEQSIEWYTQWIGVFEKFIKDYPNLDKLPTVQSDIALCQAESKNVTDGKVKFGNKWMTVKQKCVVVAESTVQSLKNRLTELQRRRTKLAQNIDVSQGNLAEAQQKLSTLQDIQVPIHGTVKYIEGYQTVPNPERGAIQDKIQFYQEQINEGQATLQKLDSEIAGIQQSQIPKAEQDYQVAVVQSQEVLKPVVAEVEQRATQPPPPPPPPAENPPIENPRPWIAQNWKPLAIGGLLFILAALLSVPLLNRRAARIQALQEQQREQRRFLYEQLKKIFDRIFVEGQRPAGKNKPEGEIVPLGRGQDDSGGGRWFVVGPSHVWAVQNNGRDEDNWALNNVVTDGHGAIGAFVPAEDELVGTIKRLAAGTN